MAKQNTPSDDVESDIPTLIDMKNIPLNPQQTARLMGLTIKTLRSLEDESSVEVMRKSRGAVTERVYTPETVFELINYRRNRKASKQSDRPTVISTYVQKGGTGKTTISVNLALSLSLLGLLVLLIDNDPQGDASTMLGYDPDLTPEEMESIGLQKDRAINAHLGNLIPLGAFFNGMSLDDVIKKPFGEHGLHLVPADDSLDDMDTILRNTSGAYFRYSIFISKAIRGEIPGCDLSRYDVILLDNAPSTSMLSRNAIIASDIILCPIRIDKFSIKALARLQNRLSEFERDFDRSPDVVAIPTFFVRGRPRAKASLDLISDHFGSKLSSTVLYHTEDYGKALEEGIPVYLWKGATENSRGAIRDLTDEIVTRIQSIQDAKE